MGHPLHYKLQVPGIASVVQMAAYPAAALFLLLLSSPTLFDPHGSAIQVAAAAAAKGPLVGQLIKNMMSLQLGTPPQKLQQLPLDLDASVSTVRCGKRGAFNPSKSSTYSSKGSLFSDVLTINSTDGTNPTGPASVPGVRFACAKSSVASLSRSPKSLPSQLASKRKISKKFTYCLSASSSSPSPIFFGVDTVKFMPNGRPISPLLQYTPLLDVPDRHHYYIGLNGLTVNAKAVPVDPSVFTGGTRLSSTEPYTRLVRPAYVAIREAYRNLTFPRVPPVAPFDTCFNASAFSSTRVGPAVPPVTLELTGNVTWTLFGANTIVFLNDNTVGCLAFVDAGPPPATSVIGTFQQLDNLVEFDIDRKRFGFTGILYFFQTTCSNFNFTLSS